MARKMKRPYFAQNNLPHPHHKSKHFATPEEARVWLRENGGGTIKHMPSAYRKSCEHPFIEHVEATQ